MKKIRKIEENRKYLEELGGQKSGYG